MSGGEQMYIPRYLLGSPASNPLPCRTIIGPSRGRAGLPTDSTGGREGQRAGRARLPVQNAGGQAHHNTATIPAAKKLAPAGSSGNGIGSGYGNGSEVHGFDEGVGGGGDGAGAGGQADGGVGAFFRANAADHEGWLQSSKGTPRP